MLNALSFTAPLLLAALAALPLIWFLLRATPPSPSAVRFPAFMLLRDLENTKQTPDRTPWWLLLLRLLLAALIIIALAGPVLNAPPVTPGAGPLVVAVDNSWAAAQSWTARRDAISETAAEAAQNNRPLFIIPTAPQQGAPAPIEPITGEAARTAARTLSPAPFAADRAGALARLSELDRYLDNENAAEIRWLSDGIASGEDAAADRAFAEALAERGALTIMSDDRAPRVILRFMDQTAEGLGFRVDRLTADGVWEGELVAIARDGRELSRLALSMDQGQRTAETSLALPLALRNEIRSVRIENATSAGAVWLADARERRALIGIVADAEHGRSNLLSGGHYIRQALSPYAGFVEGALDRILDANASVIILNDVGRLRRSDVAALEQWIERGGVLIRFAGPALADAAQERTPPLLPVPLRGGGRAFGGALTWETPQTLDEFAADSPFAGLETPQDVFVRRQVLAQPGGDTTTHSWARLTDGTPLVTGKRQSAGLIALFHVTATSEWSDLPISGVFVEMLRRLTFLSSLGPAQSEDSAGGSASMRYAPLSLMDGFGRMTQPDDTSPALTLEEIAQAPAPDRRPGFYGSPDAPFALNAVSAETPFEPLSLTGFTTRPYAAQPPTALSPPLFAAALFLLLLDGILTLFITGRLPRIPGFQRPAAAALIAAIVMSGLFNAPHASAQAPLDPALEEQAVEAALTTRLAYVKTGDPATDRLSAQGLASLSRELARRTAVEPAPPDAVNLDTDDLSIYPFLYWPITPGAEAPSENALANIENFMRFGGLILFDTRDSERSLGPGSTPEARALQTIISQLDIPPLAPIDKDHVLSRSFYLVDDLSGRAGDNPVWAKAGDGGPNDGVTPVIIGGRDWAGAWATDSFGRPVRPMGRSGGRVGERAREFSYRAGVNIVMVALTGNYKSDQVHTPILLERLGR